LDEIPSRFPRAARLTTAAGFEALFRNADARSSDSAFVVLARRNGLAIGRLGLAITKKKTRLATRRNRLKRLIRESFRHHQLQLRGLDIVVIGQAGAERKSSAELRDALRRHWNKINEQCKRSSSS
jgi:ribonuclease P protein component